MKRQTFAVGSMQCNCSILTCPHTNKAIVVDPGGDIDEIKSRLGDARVKCILITHAHFDHVLAARDLQEATGAPIYLHRADRWLYRIMPLQYKIFGVKGFRRPPKISSYLRDGDKVQVGAMTLTVMHTPGHTPGSVCYHCRKHRLLIAGDTLFKGAVGAWQYPGGSLNQLVASVTDKVMQLPDDTVVVPGHGEETTIGAERAENPYLKPGEFDRLLKVESEKPGKVRIFFALLGSIFRRREG